MSVIPESLDSRIIHLCEQMKEAGYTALALPLEDLSQSATPEAYREISLQLAYLIQSMTLKGVKVNLDLIKQVHGSEIK